jgi:hypothetical protein
MSKKSHKVYTVKPLSIVCQGDGKQKTVDTGKWETIKIIDKNNLMIIITSC